ncbi:MAG: hypothetical protein EHM39_00160, partial [Chloroflexi bacterium]
MIPRRFQPFIDSLRRGASAGFTTGLILLFLILVGLPTKLENIALFGLLLVPFLFGLRLARRLHAHGLGHLLKNAVALGVIAALLAFLLMGLINSWLEKDIDVKQYFDAVSADTMTVLSGVPAEELHANPERNPLTEEYPEGEELRTNPMRLTFDSDTGLELLG